VGRESQKLFLFGFRQTALLFAKDKKSTKFGKKLQQLNRLLGVTEDDIMENAITLFF
jgi:hypothetical protein